MNMPFRGQGNRLIHGLNGRDGASGLKGQEMMSHQCVASSKDLCQDQKENGFLVGGDCGWREE